MKKGQSMGLGVIIPVVVVFLMAAIVAIHGIDILDDTREDFCDYDYDEVNEECYQCNTTHITYNTSDARCHNESSGESGLPTYYEDQSFNSTSDSMTGVEKVPEKMPTVGNVVVAAVIITVLLAAFGGFLATKSFRS